MKRNLQTPSPVGLYALHSAVNLGFVYGRQLPSSRYDKQINLGNGVRSLCEEEPLVCKSLTRVELVI